MKYEMAIPRTNFSSADAGGIFGRISLSILVLVVVGRHATAQPPPPQWVKWKIEATVTYIVDPGGHFPDVALGDPVRGTLQYDLMLSADPFFTISGQANGYNFYDYRDLRNHTWAEYASMAIENPRTSSEMKFTMDGTNATGKFEDVFVWNDQPDPGGDFDALYTVQSVVSPPGFVGGAGRGRSTFGAAVEFVGLFCAESIELG